MIDNKQIDLLNLCLEDSLFAALYEALSRLQQIWQTPSPVDMWVMALSARRNLDKSRRPDLLAGQLFGDADPHEAVVVEALVMWMLVNEDRNKKASPLKTALAVMLRKHGETWETVREEFRESEKRNEQAGYYVSQADYSDNDMAAAMCAHESPQDDSLVHDLVSTALQTANTEFCNTLYLLLSRIDCQKGHVYESDLKRLAAETDKIEMASHDPRSFVNNFYKNSCTFQQGSTMNGNVSSNL